MQRARGGWFLSDGVVPSSECRRLPLRERVSVHFAQDPYTNGRCGWKAEKPHTLPCIYHGSPRNLGGLYCLPPASTPQYTGVPDYQKPDPRDEEHRAGALSFDNGTGVGDEATSASRNLQDRVMPAKLVKQFLGVLILRVLPEKLTLWVSKLSRKDSVGVGGTIEGKPAGGHSQSHTAEQTVPWPSSESSEITDPQFHGTAVASAGTLTALVLFLNYRTKSVAESCKGGSGI
ncbi:hypothetical protein H920_12737 [Fukomys damarensis]|uniref:Uncharacterized protein n=1 Tax=Fukomys damarensis TaxID=885580 RepID=A0A091D136_FUKDA|nr:hypothetical protein H920_12737 [Fukomys damarensis]